MRTRSLKQRARAPAAPRLTSRVQVAPSSPELRFRVDFGDRCSVGIGKIRLLEAVEHTGSLSQAARTMGMSYRRAWLLIDSMNVEFDTPVISATVGGSGGGGAKLTSFGKELIEAYRRLETRLAPLTAECMRKIAAHALARPPRSVAVIRSRKSIAKSLKRARPP
jgi:molybdate transport system regulatory protein